VAKMYVNGFMKSVGLLTERERVDRIAIVEVMYRYNKTTNEARCGFIR